MSKALKATRPYNRCPECGQPMLRKGQKRKHPDDYRHAQGCPKEPNNGGER
jgi:ribosomal protein L32